MVAVVAASYCALAFLGVCEGFNLPPNFKKNHRAPWNRIRINSAHFAEKEDAPVVDVDADADADANANANADVIAPTYGSEVLALALPALVTLSLDPLMSLVDTLFVGMSSPQSPLPLSAMAVASAPLTFAVFASNFLSTATAPIVAKQMGGGEEEEARETGRLMLNVALVFGLALSAGFFLNATAILAAFQSTPSTTLSLSLPFLRIRAMAMPAILTATASIGILRGYLDTKTPLRVAFIANAVNLLVDLVTIFGLKLGSTGAAIATTSAEIIAAALFLDKLREIEISPDLIPRQLAKYKPVLLASSSVFLRTLILQSVLASATFVLGGEVRDVAAHQIALQIWLIGSFVSDCLAGAGSGLIGREIGRRNDAGVKAVTKNVVVLSTVLGVIQALILGLATERGG